MDDYNFGDVDFEFNTNRIFLLIQTIYRIENIEEKINASNGNLSYLSDDFQKFKKLIDSNRQGLEEFNNYKSNAEENNMWAEYGEYITRFAQIDMDTLNAQNPEMAKAIEELSNSTFFAEIEKINTEYCREIEKKFISQTYNYKEQAHNIVGETNTKKIIYMPFTPKLFSIEPCCLSDKNENGEYAIQFSIPTEKEEFERMFDMEYTEGIESVILFHEKLHSDIPTKPINCFKNPMQRELDSHLKHTIIELLANGEMGIHMAKHSSIFQSSFHTGKIYKGKNVLKTGELQEFGIIDNVLLHTETNEKCGEDIEHFSKEDMGIIKIRGMIYPYALMYKNRNNEQPIESVIQDIQRDAKMIEDIYGEDFLLKLQDIEFLHQVQVTVKPYDNILDFAEGMSKELLGIEQKRIFDVQEIGKGTINVSTDDKDIAKKRQKRDEQQIQQEGQKKMLK